MKKSFLLMVVMILMFSIQSYGIIDTVFVFDVAGANAPLAGITIKAHRNGASGILNTQNITATIGLMQGCCIFNIPTVVGDTIKIVPQNIFEKDSISKYTFNPLQITTVIRSVGNKTNLSFFAYTNVTSIAPAIFNTSKNNIASINNYSNILSYSLTNNCLVSIAYYDLRGRVIGKFVSKEQNAGGYSMNLPIMNYAKGTYIQVFKAGNYTKTGEIKVY